MQNLVSAKNNQYTAVWQESAPAIAWGTIALFAVYLAGYFFVVTSALNGQLPYGLASALCAYLAYVGFTVVHDAGHGSIIKMGSPLKPIEPLLGWITSVPLLLVPFPAFKRLHDRHHAFTNDPDRDPDHFTFGDKWYQVALNCLFIPLQYHILTFSKLRHIKTMRDTFTSTLIYFAIVISIVAWLIHRGFLEPLLYLLFIPNIIAVFILAMFFDYIPHHPHKSVDRYHDTRIYPSKLLNIILLGQNYHLIHHMYPRIPWYKYAQVYKRIRPDLEANDAPIEDLSNGLRPGFLQSPNARNLQANGTKVNMLLRVAEVKQLTANAVSVRFDLPGGEPLKYRAGQYVTISKWLDGEQQTRCYSLCSSASKGELKIGVRKQQGGLVSAFVNNELKAGNEMIVQGPFGDFTFVPSYNDSIDQLLLVAGGSGITPILSILETALEATSIKQTHLVYAARTIADMMFYEHIESLKKDFPDRLCVTYVANEPSCKIKRLSPEALVALLPDNQGREKTECYLCGPQGLKEIVTTTLLQNNFTANRIHTEDFVALTNEPVGILHQIDISLTDGSHYKLQVASNQTVLEVAKQKGVALPNACGVGTCGTCKFKVKKGQNPDIDDGIPGLSVDDKASGYTLACQCKPDSDLSLVEVAV